MCRTKHSSPTVAAAWQTPKLACIAITLLALVSGGCGDAAPETDRPPWQFVRGGLLVERDGNLDRAATLLSPDRQRIATSAIDLTPARQLVEFPWQPGAAYTLECQGAAHSLQAPVHPTPALLWRIPLENVRDAAASGTWPDCVVRFSPNSRWLAIGSFAGWVRVVDCHSGDVVWSRHLAEGMIKRLAWSPAGGRLYVGEQSPDGRLWAFDLSADSSGALDPRVAWSVRLADQLETSRPPAHDRFGIYTLPAVYDLHVASDGRIFVAGTHRWTIGGRLQSRSLLACYDADGRPLWQFPPHKPTAESWGLTFFAIDPVGQRVVLLATPGESPRAAHSGAALTGRAIFLQLDGNSGQEAGRYEIEPLAPHFDRVESWDSVSVAEAGDRAVLGLNDGRGLLFKLSDDRPTLLREIELATPQLIGTTPIAASASYARFHGDLLCFQTQNTHIPFGSPQAANRPPIAHRGANTLTVCDRDGNPLWLYRGPYALSGSWTDRPKSGDPRWLAVTCREQPGATEAGNFGLLLFDLQAEGGGNERLVYYYPTAGPAMFFADVSPDGGLIAVAETPTPTPDGQDLYGTYQVHIIH